MGEPRRGRRHHRSRLSEVRRAVVARPRLSLGVLVLTLACFGAAVAVPVLVIPALFCSAWLVRLTRFPWEWLLGTALVLLGLTAIAPSLGQQQLYDPLGIAAYAVAVVACAAGLLETLAERRDSGREDRSSNGRKARTEHRDGGASRQAVGASGSPEPARSRQRVRKRG